jgi:hypothetical protein
MVGAGEIRYAVAEEFQLVSVCKYRMTADEKTGEMTITPIEE